MASGSGVGAGGGGAAPVAFSFARWALGRAPGRAGAAGAVSEGQAAGRVAPPRLGLGRGLTPGRGVRDPPEGGRGGAGGA